MYFYKVEEKSENTSTKNDHIVTKSLLLKNRATKLHQLYMTALVPKDNSVLISLYSQN